MGWRQTEMKAFAPQVTPLDSPDAEAAYERAIGLCSRTRYGLNEAAFPSIERLDIHNAEDARRWLSERVRDGDLLLVFGQKDVFRTSAEMFLDQWENLFCPARDDVIILPTNGGWVMFYWHEDTFEFAKI